jgi:protein-disulfide isomerase
MSAAERRATLQVAVAEWDHGRGAESHPVTVVEYGDYECPYCVQLHRTLARVERRVTFRLVYRHFPLGVIHPHARLAAEVAEAAGAQGKFWPMHELLLENQLPLSSSTLFALAARLQLDMARFTADISQHVYGDRVWSDLMGGVRSGVNATPTLFINGLRHDGPHDPATLGLAFERALPVDRAPMTLQRAAAER